MITDPRPDVVDESAADVAMTVTSQLVHQCPHRDEVDQGEVTISWICSGSTFELHTLRDYLATFQDVKVTHEELTYRIGRELEGARGITDVRVSTRWQTAGMEVRCSTSPTPAGTRG